MRKKTHSGKSKAQSSAYARTLKNRVSEPTEPTIDEFIKFPHSEGEESPPPKPKTKRPKKPKTLEEKVFEHWKRNRPKYIGGLISAILGTLGTAAIYTITFALSMHTQLENHETRINQIEKSNDRIMNALVGKFMNSTGTEKKH